MKRGGGVEGAAADASTETLSGLAFYPSTTKIGGPPPQSPIGEENSHHIFTSPHYPALMTSMVRIDTAADRR